MTITPYIEACTDEQIQTAINAARASEAAALKAGLLRGAQSFAEDAAHLEAYLASRQPVAA